MFIVFESCAEKGPCPASELEHYYDVEVMEARGARRGAQNMFVPLGLFVLCNMIVFENMLVFNTCYGPCTGRITIAQMGSKR